MSDLNVYIDAYQKKWSHDAWRNFTCRHMQEISYLIPSNNAGATILNKLYENI